jgi:hypothetical protein
MCIYFQFLKYITRQMSSMDQACLDLLEQQKFYACYQQRNTDYWVCANQSMTRSQALEWWKKQSNVLAYKALLPSQAWRDWLHPDGKIRPVFRSSN